MQGPLSVAGSRQCVQGHDCSVTVQYCCCCPCTISSRRPVTDSVLLCQEQAQDMGWPSTGACARRTAVMLTGLNSNIVAVTRSLGQRLAPMDTIRPQFRNFMLSNMKFWPQLLTTCRVCTADPQCKGSTSHEQCREAQSCSWLSTNRQHASRPHKCLLPAQTDGMWSKCTRQRPSTLPQQPHPSLNTACHGHQGSELNTYPQGCFACSSCTPPHLCTPHPTTAAAAPNTPLHSTTSKPQTQSTPLSLSSPHTLAAQ